MTRLLIKSLKASGMETVDIIEVGLNGQLTATGPISRQMLATFGGEAKAEDLLRKYRGDYLKVVRE